MKNFDQFDKAVDFIYKYRLSKTVIQFCDKVFFDKEYKWLTKGEKNHIDSVINDFSSDSVLSVIKYRGCTFNFIDINKL